MGYSLHIPLGFGRLKIKSESRLRQREKDGKVTVWRFGSMYVVWEPRQKDTDRDGQDDSSGRSP
jgi:hypothetical protein